MVHVDTLVPRAEQVGKHLPQLEAALRAKQPGKKVESKKAGRPITKSDPCVCFQGGPRTHSEVRMTRLPSDHTIIIQQLR
jgi:hypothetical protein